MIADALTPLLRSSLRTLSTRYRHAYCRVMRLTPLAEPEALMASSPAISTVELVTELRISRPHRARFVQAAHRDRLP
jgi:hypothetical protein